MKQNFKIKRWLPFFYPILRWRFPEIAGRENEIIIAWGDAIYSRSEIQEHKLIHERVHLDRQMHSKIFGSLFIIFYLLSAKFRLQEELLAYRAEYQWLLKRSTNPRLELQRMSRDLASYGKMVTEQQALYLITQ